MQNNDWMNMIENMNGIRLFSRSLIPRATKEHEISSQHLDLLCHLIINNDGMTPLKLSKVMGVSKTIISRLIDGLSKSGYVIKKQDDNDKRTNRIKLTKKGIEIKDRLSNLLEEWNNEITSDIDKNLLNTVIDTINKMSIKAIEKNNI